MNKKQSLIFPLHILDGVFLFNIRNCVPLITNRPINFFHKNFLIIIKIVYKTNLYKLKFVILKYYLYI